MEIAVSLALSLRAMFLLEFPPSILVFLQLEVTACAAGGMQEFEQGLQYLFQARNAQVTSLRVLKDFKQFKKKERERERALCSCPAFVTSSKVPVGRPPSGLSHLRPAPGLARAARASRDATTVISLGILFYFYYNIAIRNK